MHDGLVFRGKRLVIPKSIQPEMTKTLHSSHIHVVRVPIWRARECLYWPYMNAKMKHHIAACETCNRHAVRQQNETLVSHEITERPWEKVGSDLFTIQGKEYLILVNWFSNFWEIDYLRDTRATTCIKHSRDICQRQRPTIYIWQVCYIRARVEIWAYHV